MTINIIKPKMLRKGDTIAFIAPSSGLGGVFSHRLDNAKKALHDLGFNIKEYPTARKCIGETSGTVKERISDIHSAFSDPNVKGIICTIGGLSSNELIKDIDYNIIKNNPKVFCGYSDISVLQYAFFSKTGLVTFYGPAAMTQFGEYPKPLQYTIEYFKKAVMSSEPIGKVAPSTEWTDEVLDWSGKEDMKRSRKVIKNSGYKWLRKGNAKGKIIGGCITSVQRLRGTEFDLNPKNCILFLETPEGQDFTKGLPISYADSYFQDLRNAGVFDKIKGLIVGRPFGYTEEEAQKFEEIIKKHTAEYKFPVLINTNIGHADPIMTVPIGVDAELNGSEFIISENGVID